MTKKTEKKTKGYTVEVDNTLVFMADPSILNKEIELQEEPKGYYKEWVEYRPNEFIPSALVSKTFFLPAGSYSITWDYNNNWPVFVKRPVKLDELLMLPNPIFTSVLEDIQYFWSNKQKFLNYKFAYKRGILLYGPPGCGKTSLISLLSEDIINRGGIVIGINDVHDLQIYTDSVGKIFRNIQPNTPILVVMEDLDGLASVREAETMLLNVLDGTYQLSNVVYLACTNFPEKLQDRILNRPSRFDKRYLIDLPTSEVRKFYLERKIHATDLAEINLDEIVEQTDGLSLAHLGEFVKSAFIFKKSIEDSIISLKNMSTSISSTQFTIRKTTGFSK